ncbi:ADP-ribosylation factor [Seminavis robusta]|uniref:ADP-ribosylation factor n=1 Tax=Seminavis robusta TaxID=568900 RepID=A0A9N8HPD1_9STRA|nr:ADP-ribosylation factor [Seminavis robusta]|eukprot:Sro1059_g236460.1 ADP-ribosylation factor (349) ;mRNA; r:3116-4278
MGNNNSSSISSSSWSPRAWLGSSIPCLKPKREHKLLIHGLDSSGKTTLLYRLKMGEVVTTIPTIGFNVETLKFEGREFVAWDVGGRDKIRPLMRHYYPGTDGVIFMVDSNDEDRMQQARDEFYRLVTDELMENKPVLLLCNKQDLPNAWSPERVAAFFGVETANKTTRMVHVLGCVATKAENVWEGLEWLAMAIESDGAKDGEESDTEEEQLEEETEDLATVAHPEKRKRSHDPTAPANPTLKHFQPIKQGTMCPFAKAAKLWGGISQKHTLDAKELASSHAEALTKFVRCSDSQKLDGFCMELGDPRAQSADPEDVGACVKEMLTLLSDLDPAKEHVMSVNYVGSRA